MMQRVRARQRRQLLVGVTTSSGAGTKYTTVAIGYRALSIAPLSAQSVSPPLVDGSSLIAGGTESAGESLLRSRGHTGRGSREPAARSERRAKNTLPGRGPDLCRTGRATAPCVPVSKRGQSTGRVPCGKRSTK